jgi:hypothetical protein
MTKVIKFPEENIDTDFVRIKAGYEKVFKVLDELMEDGIGGLFLLELGPRAVGSFTKISGYAIASFICEMLDDKNIHELTIQLMKERLEEDKGTNNGKD